MEIIEVWIKAQNPVHIHGNTWHGTASEFKSQMSKIDEVAPLISSYSSIALGRKFSEAANVSNSYIRRDPSKFKGNGARYNIDLKGLTESLGL